jgi:predicted patatin/cPLA2 family phospholipase
MVTVFAAFSSVFFSFHVTNALQLRTSRLAFKRLARRGPSINKGNLHPASTVTPPTSSADSTSQRKYRNDGDDDISQLEEVSSVQRLVTLKKLITPASTIRSKLPSTSLLKRKQPTVVRTVDELRAAILDRGLSLKDTEILCENNTAREQDIANTSAPKPASVPTDFFDNHAVRHLMKQRYDGQSMPGFRSENDTYTLALSIEGGGMRGCVSAGMVAAIAALGLSDTIDKVYGSSAGSVVGAYFVSRQVCMDVYVDILPAAQKLFVCKKRMIKSLASSLVDVLVNSVRRENANARSPAQLNPGMNISFVLDGIMGQDHGIRPLDFETFRQNDAKQPLRVVSSAIDPETGRLFSKCFGTTDFFSETAVETVDGSRNGLFACLQASMTVPGATGPPVNIRQPNSDKVFPCFDAFCFEPIPYRSAVEEGASHVLVLSSRPEDFQPVTRPGIYETGVAPIWFHSHGHGAVADFFDKGGQQYLYAEDLLALEEAKTKKILFPGDEENQRVAVPPAEILYGVPETPAVKNLKENRDVVWKRAHLMPLRVPRGHRELPTLEQGKDAVLEAVRGGFATAFDSLSSIVNLDHIRGADAAMLVFPEDEDWNESEILGSVMQIPGMEISEPSLRDFINEMSFEGAPKRLQLLRVRGLLRRMNKNKKPSASTPKRRLRLSGLLRRNKRLNVSTEDDVATVTISDELKGAETKSDPFGYSDINRSGFEGTSTSLVGSGTNSKSLSSQMLLASLPGFQGGRFGHLARGLTKKSP